MGYKKIKLLPGQFIYGRNSAADELNMKPSTVRNCIEYLKQDKCLDRKATSKYSIITVRKWEGYQIEDKSEDNKVTAGGERHEVGSKTHELFSYEKDLPRIGKFGLSAHYNYCPSDGCRSVRNQRLMLLHDTDSRCFMKTFIKHGEVK